jgi:hypothetical protein
MDGVIPPIPIRLRGVPRTLFRFILLKCFPETCNVMLFIVYGLGVVDFSTSHPQGLGGGMGTGYICGDDRYSMGHDLDLLFPCFVVKLCLTTCCDVCNVYVCRERGL